MKKKNIYILIGTLVGVGLLIWLVIYLGKQSRTTDTSSNGGGTGTGNSGNGGINWNFDFGGDEGGDFDYDLNVGGGLSRDLDAGFGNRTRGVNAFESPNYSEFDYRSVDYRGFNDFDATAPRGELVPLSKARQTIYTAPYNQNGGTIKTF
jgi:hypothetical protein